MDKSKSGPQTASGGFTSFLATLAKRKRLVFAVTALVGTLLLWTQFSNGDGVRYGSSEPVFDEFQGLLYYLTRSEKLLPAQLDGSEAQESTVWSSGSKLNAEQWKARISKMHRDYPVIVFSKTYCPYSKKAKAILAEYPLKKTPVFIEADMRPDGPKIKALLDRLTGQATFPNVVIAGKTIGGADRTSILHESGALKKKLRKAGAL